MVLDVDLNVPPPEHSHSNGVGASTHAPVVQDIHDGQQRLQPSLVTIDVDSVDDDVVLCSQRAFVEAKNKSRRTRSRRNIVDVELVESTNRDTFRNKRPRVPANQPIINCESYVIPERNGNSGNGANIAGQTRVVVAPPPPRPPPPPPEPTFNCPVCLGPLVEEMSTKCGHIFCKACIKKAISAQSKCPTCRRKVTARDIIRVYLPKTS